VIQPRLLRRAQVLELLNVRSSTLARWMQIGLVPKPLPGTSVWDRVAIERAIDRASGLEQPAPRSAWMEALERADA